MGYILYIRYFVVVYATTYPRNRDIFSSSDTTYPLNLGIFRPWPAASDEKKFSFSGLYCWIQPSKTQYIHYIYHLKGLYTGFFFLRRFTMVNLTCLNIHMAPSQVLYSDIQPSNRGLYVHIALTWRAICTFLKFQQECRLKKYLRLEWNRQVEV